MYVRLHLYDHLMHAAMYIIFIHIRILILYLCDHLMYEAMNLLLTKGPANAARRRARPSSGGAAAPRPTPSIRI